jgi:hypothetical protein
MHRGCRPRRSGRNPVILIETILRKTRQMFHAAQDNCWVSRRDGSHRIEEGSSVVFTVSA